MRKIENFMVSIGYITIMLFVPGLYRIKKPRTEKFFDSPKYSYRDAPKRKEYGRRLVLGIFGFIISISILLFVVLFLSSLFA